MRGARRCGYPVVVKPLNANHGRGVSIGLTANAILRRGTIAQKERFVPDLLTLESIGAWRHSQAGRRLGL